MLKLPRIQPVLQGFEKRKKEEAWETAKGQVRVTREFLDEQLILRLVNMKTHPKLGDMPIVKMLETGYKRTGDIQSPRISNHASAGLMVAPGGTRLKGERKAPMRLHLTGSKTKRYMPAPLPTETRVAILGKLRHAVAYQIGLWDTASELAEMLDRELDDVLEAIMHPDTPQPASRAQGVPLWRRKEKALEGDTR